MKKYRKLEKRQAQKEYIMKSRLLNGGLSSGAISQEEYDRAHEDLDEQYRYVR